MTNDFNTDASLAKKGDSNAFARLYSAIYKDLYRTALYCLKNPDDACDAVSDAVIDAFATIGKLRDECAFKQWMFKILYAKIKRKLKEYANKTTELCEDTLNPEHFNFETLELKDALERLDTQSRSILSMSVIGGYTSVEISKICGIPPTTIRSKLTRIKEKLRLTMEEAFI